MSWMMHLTGTTQGYVDNDGRLAYGKKPGDFRDELGCNQHLEIRREFGWWDNCFFLWRLFCHDKRDRLSDYTSYMSKRRMRRIVRICDKILALQGVSPEGWYVPEDITLNDKALRFANKVFLGDLQSHRFSHFEILFEIKRTRRLFNSALEESKTTPLDFEIDWE
jgi:hypothetical protein